MRRCPESGGRASMDDDPTWMGATRSPQSHPALPVDPERLSRRLSGAFNATVSRCSPGSCDYRSCLRIEEMQLLEIQGEADLLARLGKRLRLQACRDLVAGCARVEEDLVPHR